MSDLPHFDRKMSDAEGLMWRLEKDPHLSSTFAAVTILDRPPNFDRLLARMDRAVHVVTRLGQRVQPMPANLTAPTWVDDANFDLRFHVRHLALPKPGTMRQLLDLASLIACDPFDRTRPLWQFVVVDGLRGGKSALIEKLHHTITDGEGSVKLSLQFLDFERDAPDPPPLDATELDDREPAPADSNGDLFRDLLAGSLRMPLGLLRQIKDLLSDPTSIPDAGSAAADTVRGIMSQLADTEQARSPLWTQRSLKRRMEVLRARSARRGQPPSDWAARSTPRSSPLRRRPLGAITNGWARSSRSCGPAWPSAHAPKVPAPTHSPSARMLVPTGEMSIAERFIWIQAAAGAARESNATASLETLAAVASTLPTSLITRLARQQAQTVDFATSNVRGAPVPLYVAGAEVLQNYAVGPLAGVAYNLTLLSYNHSLDMGVNIDTAAVTEPELLRECLEKAFADLISV